MLASFVLASSTELANAPNYEPGFIFAFDAVSDAQFEALDWQDRPVAVPEYAVPLFRQY